MAYDPDRRPPWKCPDGCPSTVRLHVVSTRRYKMHEGSMTSLTFHFDSEEDDDVQRIECPMCGTSWPVPDDCAITFEMVEGP